MNNQIYEYPAMTIKFWKLMEAYIDVEILRKEAAGLSDNGNYDNSLLGALALKKAFERIAVLENEIQKLKKGA